MRIELILSAPSGHNISASDYDEDNDTIISILSDICERIAPQSAAAENFVIDFFEQGVERKLGFQANGSDYDIHCGSLTDFRPNPEWEKMDGSSVRQMLGAAMDGFSHYVREYYPEIDRHPWYREWADASQGIIAKP